MMASIFGLLPPTEDEKDKGRRGKKNKPEIQSNVVGAVMESFIEGARSILEKAYWRSSSSKTALSMGQYMRTYLCRHLSSKHKMLIKTNIWRCEVWKV